MHMEHEGDTVRASFIKLLSFYESQLTREGWLGGCPTALERGLWVTADIYGGRMGQHGRR